MYVTYVCMYVFVCLSMKSSVSFDPNNAKFTQKIDVCTGRVMHYIRLKKIQNWMKKQFFKKGSVAMKLHTKCFSWNVARFFRTVFICCVFQGHLLSFLSLWGCLFIYLLLNVCMYVCICLFVWYKKGSITFDPNNTNFTQKIDDCTGEVINFIQTITVQNWLKNPWKCAQSLWKTAFCLQATSRGLRVVWVYL